MKERVSVPVRMVDLPAQDDPAKLAVLVRSAVQAPIEDVPLIRWRVRNTLRRQGEKRRRLLRVVLVGSVLFLTGGVVGAVMGPILVARGKSATPVQLDTVAPPARAAHKRFRTAPAALTPIEDVFENVLEETPRTPGQSALPAPLPASAEVMQSAEQRTPAARTAPAAQSAAGATAAAGRRAYASPTVAARQAAPSPSVAAPVVGPAMAWPSLGEAALSPPSPAIQPAPAEDTAGKAIASAPPSESRQRTLHDSSAAPIAYSWAPNRFATSPTPVPSSVPNAVARPLAAPEAHAAGSASEQALLTKAFRSLRSARDANTALAVLDEYLAHFPTGALAPEAARLRTEALLLLGRKQAALAELERGDPSAIPAGDERRLLRGELRAAAGRWRAAAEDFDAFVHSNALAGAPADTKSSDRLERALWGHASACSHLGDDASARSVLQEYLRRFPHGRFATDAAHLLGDQR
jgi:hypothetical protein